MRKDKSPKETIEEIQEILKNNNLTYKVVTELNNAKFFYSLRVTLIELSGTGAEEIVFKVYSLDL